MISGPRYHECTRCPSLCSNSLLLKGQKTGKEKENRQFTSSSRFFDFLLVRMHLSPHSLFSFPTGIRAANSCQTDAFIQSASRLSPRPHLILPINNPADSSLFFSNKEMDYTARLKANKLPRRVWRSPTATGPLMSE